MPRTRELCYVTSTRDMTNKIIEVVIDSQPPRTIYLKKGFFDAVPDAGALLCVTTTDGVVSDVTLLRIEGCSVAH